MLYMMLVFCFLDAVIIEKQDLHECCLGKTTNIVTCRSLARQSIVYSLFQCIERQTWYSDKRCNHSSRSGRIIMSPVSTFKYLRNMSMMSYTLSSILQLYLFVSSLWLSSHNVITALPIAFLPRSLRFFFYAYRNENFRTILKLLHINCTIF